MAKETRIVLVVDKNGDTITRSSIWGKAPLFEITEGPHQGKRGPDYWIFDLVGHIRVDRSVVSDYHTGKHTTRD